LIQKGLKIKKITDFSLPTNLRAWELFFWSKSGSKYLFFAILHCKIREGPSQSPTWLVGRSWAGHFGPKITWAFFCPALCSGLGLA
jgi:hypothetical protein